MNSKLQIPNWLAINRIDDRHYQLTDVSTASIGLCLGVFPCREAAEALAAKIAQSRVFRPVSFFSAASMKRNWKTACSMAAEISNAYRKH
jgi:hypothetical protein